MNYYEHHIGDYDADTSHLTWCEDMAYTRLLRLYYRREKPIPVDVNDACRLVRAVARAEKQAVTAVLNEFFVLAEDGWHQSRADTELGRYSKRVEHNRAVGMLGGRPKKTGPPSKPGGFSPGLQKEPEGIGPGSETKPEQNPPQTPDTRHQSPDTKNTHTPLEIVAEAREPNAAGRVCRLMRQAGVDDTNPGHPMLLALLEAGCSDAEFAGAAATAVDREKGFSYAIGMVRKQREEAAAAVLHQGELPQRMSPGQAAAHARIAAATPGLLPRKTQPMEVVDVSARRLG